MTEEPKKSRRAFFKQAGIAIAGVAVGAGGYYFLNRPTRSTEQEVRAFINQFIDAQNAHDLTTVGKLLWDSPSLL